jgi:hypothetical protein
VSDGSPQPIDEQIAAAVRDGVRAEAAPVGRHLAEVRGMSVRAIRQLERIEETIGAERTARVDDLAVLVELVSAGWRTVDERLARIEELLGGDERLDIIALADSGSAAPTLPGAEQDELPHADAA